MRDGPSSSRSRPEALDSLTVEKTRGLEVEDFVVGLVGLRLPEEGAGEAPAKVAKAGSRRKTAG